MAWADGQANSAATATTSAPAPSDDRFIAGYVSALLERDFQQPSATVTVEHGAVRVVVVGIAPEAKSRMETAIKRIPGVTSVDIASGEPATVPGAPVAANQPSPTPNGQGVEAKAAARPWTLFASTTVFEPLISDPRWPNFSAAYDHYVGDNKPLEDVASVSFGESLSLYEATPDPHSQLEFGVQAAVFAIFDLDSRSHDLVNADYFVGPVAEYRNGDFSGLLRVYHQSSHVGDEFLLAHPGFHRVNLSYEEIDALPSYDLFNRTIRVYGGGGWLFDPDPKNLKRWSIQYGVEYRGPRIFPSVPMIPVVGLDVQNRQVNSWNTDISARAGVQFSDPASLGRTVQLLLEYYNGHSPNGQFFTEKIQYYGIGLHFYP